MIYKTMHMIWIILVYKQIEQKRKTQKDKKENKKELHVQLGDTFCIYKYDYSIVYKHWSETHEFITQTVELWNRWIRLSC